jgi:PAS domain S-box-containing protein
MIPILYVDDEPVLLDIAKIYLERSGTLQVDTAVSAAEAIGMLKSRKYDGIISDYQMPGMDGIEFLKYIRAEWNDLPFILFTGKGREEVVINALNNGADSYLQKGSDTRSQFAELEHKIRQAIGKRQAEEELRCKNDELSAAYEQLTSNEEELRTKYDELMKSQQQIREREQFISAVVKEVQEGIIVYDRELKITLWNSFMERLTGLPAVTVLGQTANGLFPFHKESGVTLLLERALAGSTGESGDFPFSIKSTGRKGWAKGLYSPHYDATGEIIGAIAVVRDITKQKETEYALRESEGRIAQIIDFLPDATFAIDIDSRVIIWNRAMEEMTGVPAQEMIGKGNYEYAMPFYGIRRPILIDLVFSPEAEIPQNYSFVRLKGDVLTAETINVSLQGKRVVLWGKAAPLYDMQGGIIGAIESVRDITELRLSGDSLIQVHQKTRPLSSVKRHDILKEDGC